MSLRLYYHPLSSFCHKSLIGLYERGLAFEKQLVDLSDEADRNAFREVWPMGKFPVLRDEARDRVVPESSIILEYIDALDASGPRLLPADASAALSVRLADRFYDLHIHLPMQKIVGDRIRPEAQRDPLGVEQARTQIRTAYGIADDQLRTDPWAAGASFTLADCAAAPALFYANKVVPFADHLHIVAYFARLSARPSYARVLEEAQPYMKYFPA